MWMEEILHHFEPWLNPWFVGIYRGIIIPGFVRWCRVLSIDSIMPTVVFGGIFFPTLGFPFGLAFACQEGLQVAAKEQVHQARPEP